jgi:hypothetical protein
MNKKKNLLKPNRSGNKEEKYKGGDYMKNYSLSLVNNFKLNLGEVIMLNMIIMNTLTCKVDTAIFLTLNI